jgi:hypothetical protein
LQPFQKKFQFNNVFPNKVNNSKINKLKFAINFIKISNKFHYSNSFFD